MTTDDTAQEVFSFLKTERQLHTSTMTTMTPIRVRGKRHATRAEKWNSGKQRQPVHGKSITSSEPDSSAQSTSSEAKSQSRRRRRRVSHELSRLEELPTEVLQTIFENSANVNLPLASPRLSSQLASQHLYHQLTSSILQPVLGGKRSTPSELAAAMRLMNSMFFTWTFFKDWLYDRFEALGLLHEWQDAVESGSATMQPERQGEWTWYKLRPHSGLLPPKKLILGPFTYDKVRFLRFLTSSYREDPDQIDPLYRELAIDGLRQAVSEGAGEALPAFWTLGVEPDTELLRHAVIDSGCEKNVVQRLVTRVVHLASEPIDVDFLDPALWSWADKAGGDGKGSWLMEVLKDAARASGRKEVEIQHAKAVAE